MGINAEVDLYFSTYNFTDGSRNVTQGLSLFANAVFVDRDSLDGQRARPIR